MAYLEDDLLVLLHGLPQVVDLGVLLLEDGLEVAHRRVRRRRRLTVVRTLLLRGRWRPPRRRGRGRRGRNGRRTRREVRFAWIGEISVNSTPMRILKGDR